MHTSLYIVRRQHWQLRQMLAVRWQCKQHASNELRAQLGAFASGGGRLVLVWGVCAKALWQAPIGPCRAQAMLLPLRRQFFLLVPVAIRATRNGRQVRVVQFGQACVWVGLAIAVMFRAIHSVRWRREVISGG